ncbi:MAG: hypothetical protein H0X41_01420 [Chitinophagaceae bacterium]|nr:hypothetical protein [Chitinophagaceae bacterium]
MERRKNIIRRVGAVKLFSVAMMLVCLTFLTSVNYFLYPTQKAASDTVSGKNTDGPKNNFPPSGPTEEKSSSSGVSILEEFLHDPHPVINFGVEGQLHLHGIADSGRILVYHGELLSPPPEL